MASNSLLRPVALPLSNRGETFSQISAHNKRGGARPRSDWPKSLRNFGASGASEGLPSGGDLCLGSNLRAPSLSGFARFHLSEKFKMGRQVWES